MATKKQELKIIKPTTGAMAAAEKVQGLIVKEDAPTPPTLPTTTKKSRKSATDPVVTSGIGAKQSTFDAIERIAELEGFTPNAIKRFALEYFIRQYEQGHAKTDLNNRRIKTDKLG